jgi:hypothetical protein
MQGSKRNDSTDGENADWERYQHALPFLVNGTLTDSERAWAEGYSNTEDAAASLAFEQRVRAAVLAEAAASPSLAGLALLRKRIGQDTHQLPLFARLGSWLDRNARPAMALAGVLLVVQMAGFTALLESRHGAVVHGEQFRGFGSEGAQATLRVLFDRRAAPDRIMATLQRLHLQIVAGPSQIGEVWVMLPPGTDAQGIEQARSTLLAEGVAAMADLDTVGPGAP